MILKKSGDWDHPCLFPDLSGENIWFLTTEYDVNCRFFEDVIHQTEPVPIYSKFAKSFFIMNKCWILLNAFSSTIDGIM